MQKKYILLTLLFVSVFTTAQQMPIDFENSNHNFTVFNGTSFSRVDDPTNLSNKVGRFVNSGATGQGFFIDLNSRSIDMDSQNEITLDFYKSDINQHEILVKLERGTNADVEIRKIVPAGNANTWQNFTFDFSSASGQYSRLTIFIDIDNSTSGTYLMDNISDGTSAVNPNELDVIYNNLVWSDEFDTDGAVDNTKWHHQTFGPNGGRWFNDEQQHYTNRIQNSKVENGNLIITAKKETRNQNGVTLNYTSARLNSKFAFTYGRVDVRAKLPFGDGTWPAIWTLGKNISEQGAWFQTQGFGSVSWPDCGELDIMEHGLHATNVVSSAVHTRTSHGATVNTSTKALTDVANEWHVYSMNWSPNKVVFMIDGEGYYTYNKPANFVDANNDGIDDGWPFSEDQFLLLNVAMGGIGGTIDPNFTESSMIIDYVRVFQNTGTASVDDVFANKFKMFPNPAKDLVRIQTEENIDKVEVYSVIGKKVHQQIKSTEINIQNLQSGLYLLKIYADSKVVTKKLVVNN